MHKNPVPTEPRHNSAMASSANSAALLQRHKPPRLHEMLNENNHEMFLHWRAERQGNMFFKRFSTVFWFCDGSARYGHTLHTIGWVDCLHLTFLSLSIRAAGRYAPRRCASMPRLCWSWPCSGQLGRWSKCSPFSPCLDTSTWGEMPKKNRSTIIG